MINYIFRNSFWTIKKRPKITVPYTLLDLIVEIAGLVAILFMWIVLIVTYSKLPDSIPMNYDISGQINKYGGKSNIIILVAITTVVFIGMTILSRFPRVFNYPVIITENNAFLQYRNMARMIRCLKLAIILVFGYFVIHTVFYTGENIGIFVMPLALAIVFIPTIYFIVKSFMYR